MRDKSALLSPVIVIVSGLLSSASFLLNDGRTEWYLLKPLYRFFGDAVLTTPGFLVAGVTLYIVLWIYLSISLFILLKLFRSDVSLPLMFQSISAGFILPHALLFPFGLFSSYFVHITAIVVFGILIPFSATPYAMKRATNADFYRRSLSLMISLYAILVCWTTFYEPLGLI
jgi:hypothetical protein